MSGSEKANNEVVTVRKRVPLALGWGILVAVTFTALMVPIMGKLGRDIPFVPSLAAALLGFGIAGFFVADAVLARRAGNS